MNRNNIYHKYKNFSYSPRYHVARAPGTPYETISPNERRIVFVMRAYRSRYVNKVISGRLVGKYPLTLDDRIKEARKKLARMSVAKKWQLVEKSYGMWKDYTEDWLERIRKGTWSNDYLSDTSETSHALSS